MSGEFIHPAMQAYETVLPSHGYKFPIVETFDSIEGEGKRAGAMAVFIRLAGCPLRCRWCDTKYGLRVQDAAERLTSDQLMGRVKAYPWKLVTITGGEPLSQPVLPFIKDLACAGYEVNIETSGAVPLLPYRPQGIFYSMDWKCPGSGENYRMRRGNLWELGRDDVLKFVVCDETDLREVIKIHNDYTAKGVEHPQFFISPVFGEIEPKQIVDFVKRHRMNYARIQIQMHKVIWPPDMRGV